ncbi:SGNH/GDSL hydrolase family protein [Candidatus Woesearchaeota archaeon]|nr:SGNH/GDSL hydrolase family protein [Candidatus Woesearchaeota archaeon]
MKGFLKNLLLVVLSLCFILISLEGLLRLKDRSIESSNPLHCYNRGADFSQPQMKPGCKIPGININSLGFRSRELSRKEMQKLRRVAIVGESVAFGWGATSNQTTFACQLEDFLGPSKYAVLNAGVPSRSLTDTVKYYHGYVSRFDPEVIIVFCGWNDLHSCLAVKSFQNLFQASHLFRRVYGKLWLFYLCSTKEISQVNGEVVADFEKNLRRFAQEVSLTGKKMIVLTLPTYLNPRMGYKEYAREIAGNLGTHVNVATVIATYNRFNNIIRELKDIPNVYIADVAAEFDEIPLEEKKKLFIGEIVHLSDAGQLKIARFLYDHWPGKK